MIKITPQSLLPPVHTLGHVRAPTHMHALSIRPKIIEMEILNPDPHPCPHAKNGKQGKEFLVGSEEVICRVGVEAFSVLQPSLGTSEKSPKEETARDLSPCFLLVSSYPSFLPTSVSLALPVDTHHKRVKLRSFSQS